jgi:hypothetical protein
LVSTRACLAIETAQSAAIATDTMADKLSRGWSMTLSATSLATISQALERSDQAAKGIREATEPTADPEDRVDLSTEAIGLLAAKNGYDAAVQLTKTADEIDRHAIDLVG